MLVVIEKEVRCAGRIEGPYCALVLIRQIGNKWPRGDFLLHADWRVFRVAGEVIAIVNEDLRFGRLVVRGNILRAAAMCFLKGACLQINVTNTALEEESTLSN